MSALLSQLTGRERESMCAANDTALGITSAREIRAYGNHRIALNDEPERTWEQVQAEADAEARAELRRHRVRVHGEVKP